MPPPPLLGLNNWPSGFSKVPPCELSLRLGKSEQVSSVRGDEGIEGDDMLLATRVSSRRNSTGVMSPCSYKA